VLNCTAQIRAGKWNATLCQQLDHWRSRRLTSFLTTETGTFSVYATATEMNEQAEPACFPSGSDKFAYRSQDVRHSNSGLHNSDDNSVNTYDRIKPFLESVKPVTIILLDYIICADIRKNLKDKGTAEKSAFENHHRFQNNNPYRQRDNAAPKPATSAPDQRNYISTDRQNCNFNRTTSTTNTKGGGAAKANFASEMTNISDTGHCSEMSAPLSDDHDGKDEDEDSDS
jgi:hypothetical protein